MINCQDCQDINNMTKECNLNKPQRFDEETQTVTPMGDCRQYFERVCGDE